MDLLNVRGKIDQIDEQILDLFCQRMELAKDVAASKANTGKPVFDPVRERAKLADIAERAPQGLQNQAIAVFSLLMSMNKAAQMSIINRSGNNALSARTRSALAAADVEFPRIARVCCQGVEGAYSQIAACKLFAIPTISYSPTFDGVFQAVAEGTVDYGVLPIENSTAGSVNAVYDLLAAYRFHIVRSLRLKIDHNLLAKPGCALDGIGEVFSHQQALDQCAGYLRQLGVKTTICQNTAQAAELVSRSKRTDVAAISSRACASLYGLELLQEDIQDSDGNYTRFVVISKDAIVYPGANRSSIMLTLTSEPGALYRVLERIYALNINLVKLESRPIPGRDFQFTFYFDLECSATCESFATLLDSLDDVTSSFTYFGSYSEIL